MPGFVLPEAPAELAGKAVRAWSAPVVIPTYEPMPADKNPMFLEKRVYQGSSGKVYPLPFVDRISTEKKDRAWQAIHIENEYVRLMILPELGGRIHVGLDKTNGYDFFYRQNVIKPALVGLAGPWISGGVEFNWPQHHRPSTFMPVDTHIEEHQDGSVTVWCSEHEPMNRMKGMHGVHLRPGSSLIELKVRLYNRTELPQTFLWWANVAARVHEQYQSFFPPDVQYVADHAKRAMARFPLCEGKYYGVDYAARANAERGMLNDESGAAFPPRGDYARNDLTWYANIPVPTSYMILGTKEDFFGGYDHAAQAGFVHVADHRIAPGKKQWTWGNHPFGYAWDRNLTDPDDPEDRDPPYRRHLPAPYIELMAGVFTDNQPDFSYLMPGETRSFSQYWYPIQKIGPVQKANTDIALSLSLNLTKLTVGIAVTRELPWAHLTLRAKESLLWDSWISLTPGKPFTDEVDIAGCDISDIRLTVYEKDKGELISYQPTSMLKKDVPHAAREPDLPENVKSNDELFLIGLHLEQYRHATRRPDEYWIEALRRDPGDVRCNNAIGLWYLNRGEFGKAIQSFQTAIATATKYNPNPRDGEPFYNLGVALRHLNRTDEALDAFQKAAWDKAWKSPSHFAAAQIHCLNEDWLHAEELFRSAYASSPDNIRALILAMLAQRRDSTHSREPGHHLLSLALERDPLDFEARFANNELIPCDMQTRLDIALDLMKCGFLKKSVSVIETASDVPNNSSPLALYYLAFLNEKCGRPGVAEELRRAAAGASPDYCFPHRLEEIAILLDAIDKNPEDARAPYYLGCLLYDKRRHEEAITWWEKAAKLDRDFPTVWRNLGIGYYNILHDAMAAKGAYQKAFTNSLKWGAAEGTEAPMPALPSEHLAARVVRESPGSPSARDAGGAGEANREIRVPAGDARILYERDQLWKRTQETPAARVAELEKYRQLVDQRDDLTIEYCTLLNQLGRYDEALAILKARQFQPWEGGEGLVLGQWARANLALGRKALWLAPSEGGNPRQALGFFEAALHPPENLGEAWHLLQNNSELHYWAGMAARVCERGGTRDERGTVGAHGATHAQRPFGPTTVSESNSAPLSMAHGSVPRSRAHFEAAAASVGDFQGMAVREFSEATYWAAMALKELGRTVEARGLLEGMLAYAERLKGAKARIDYFATSLPTMLIFEDDIQAVQDRHAILLEAMARHGLNGARGQDRNAARRLLNDLLAENPSHALAADLMIALDWGLE